MSALAAPVDADGDDKEGRDDDHESSSKRSGSSDSDETDSIYTAEVEEIQRVIRAVSMMKSLRSPLKALDPESLSILRVIGSTIELPSIAADDKLQAEEFLEHVDSLKYSLLNEDLHLRIAEVYGELLGFAPDSDSMGLGNFLTSNICTGLATKSFGAACLRGQRRVVGLWLAAERFKTLDKDIIMEELCIARNGDGYSQVRDLLESSDFIFDAVLNSGLSCGLDFARVAAPFFISRNLLLPTEYYQLHMLLQACSAGDVEMVRIILEARKATGAGYSLDDLHADSRPEFSLPSDMTEIEVFSSFLLSSAVVSGSLPLIDLLLAQWHSDAKLQKEQSDPHPLLLKEPLAMASASGHLHVVQHLLASLPALHKTFNGGHVFTTGHLAMSVAWHLRRIDILRCYFEVIGSQWLLKSAHFKFSFRDLSQLFAVPTLLRRLDLLQLLIKDCSNFDNRQHFHASALSAACYIGYDAAVDLLLQYGPSVVSATAFRFALQGRHISIIRKLVSAGADVNQHWCPSSIASVNKILFSRNFLDNGAVCRFGLRRKMNLGWLRGVTGIVRGFKVLLSAFESAPPPKKIEQFNRRKGECDIDSEQLDSALIPCFRPDYTALQISVLSGDLELTTCLLELGADTSIALPDFKNVSPVLLAAALKHTAITELLMAALKPEPEEMTLLFQIACSSWDVPCMDLLLQRGAFVDTLLKELHPPLVAACWDGNIAACELLLHHGASLRCTARVAPLYTAMRGANPVAITNLLIQHGVDLNTSISSVELILPTVLNWLEIQNTELAALLLANGASLVALNLNERVCRVFLQRLLGNEVFIKAVLFRMGFISRFEISTAFDSEAKAEATIAASTSLKSPTDLQGSDSKSPTTDGAVAVVDNDLCQLLLAKAADGTNVLDEILRRHPELFDRNLKNDSMLQLLLRRTPPDSVRMHLCGPGGAGKSTLRFCMQQATSQLKKLKSEKFVTSRTLGVEIDQSINISNGWLPGLRESVRAYIFDHGGQQEFHVTYSNLMSHPLSLFVVVIPIIAEPQMDASGKGFHRISSAEQARRQLQHWLCMLGPLMHQQSARVVVVLNVFGKCRNAVFKDQHVNVCSRYMHQLAAQVPLWQTKFIDLNPVVLSCEAHDQFKRQLFPKLKIAWAEMLTNAQHVPVLCGKLYKQLRAMSQAPQRKSTAAVATAALIAPAQQVYDFLRQKDAALRNLSDVALDALLNYAEQAGRVLLMYETVTADTTTAVATSSTTPPVASRKSRSVSNSSSSGSGKEISRISLVVLDPNWFCSKIVGSLFTITHLEEENPMVQTSRMLKEKFRSLIGEQAAEYIVSRLPDLLHRMRLCAPMPRPRLLEHSKSGNRSISRSSEADDEVWFMTFLEHQFLSAPGESSDASDIHFGDSQQKHSERHEQQMRRFWSAVVEQQEASSGTYQCSGRLVALRDFIGYNATNSSSDDGELLLWQNFIPGSFARFQMRVNDAFWTIQHEQRDCVLNVAPFWLEVVYQTKDGEIAVAAAQLVHSDIGMPETFRVWIVGTNNAALSGLLLSDDTHISVSQSSGLMDSVLQQFVDMFVEACRMNDHGPELHSYCIDRNAIGKSYHSTMEAEQRKLCYHPLLATREALRRDSGDHLAARRLLGVNAVSAHDQMQKADAAATDADATGASSTTDAAVDALNTATAAMESKSDELPTLQNELQNAPEQKQKSNRLNLQISLQKKDGDIEDTGNLLHLFKSRTKKVSLQLSPSRQQQQQPPAIELPLAACDLVSKSVDPDKVVSISDEENVGVEMSQVSTAVNSEVEQLAASMKQVSATVVTNDQRSEQEEKEREQQEEEREREQREQQTFIDQPQPLEIEQHSNMSSAITISIPGDENSNNDMKEKPLSSSSSGGKDCDDTSALLLAIRAMHSEMQKRLNAVQLMQMKLALNDLKVPRVFVLVRPPGSLRQMVAKLRRPSRWFCEKYYLFFVCPVQRTLCATNGGKGYSLQMPYNWVVKYGRAIRFALQCCKVLNTLAKGVVPVPNVMKGIESEVLHALETPSLDDFISELTEAIGDGSATLRDDPAMLQQQVANVPPAAGACYRALAALISQVDPLLQDCGCELTVSSEALGADCAVEWVSPQGMDRFVETGQRALFWNSSTVAPNVLGEEGKNAI